MTPRERAEILRLYTELRLQRERERPVAEVRRCSRCRCPVDATDLSPGRVWCRPCENERKRDQYAANKAARVALAEQPGEAT